MQLTNNTNLIAGSRSGSGGGFAESLHRLWQQLPFPQQDLQKMATLKLAVAFSLALVVSSSCIFAQNAEPKGIAKQSIVTEYAQIDNQKIAYRKIGKGTPIILANRFRGTLDTWDPLFLELLAKSNTVITFDYAGIGYSTGELPLDIKEVAASVTKLASHLKIEKFNVMGWSYGGLVAQYTMFMYPDRVTKVVLIGTNPIGKNAVPFEPVFFERALKPVNDFEDAVAIFFEPKSEKSRAAAAASMGRIMKQADWSKVPSTQEVFQRYFASNSAVVEDKENLRARYATLKTPILVLSADHDISFATENWFPLMKVAPTLQHVIFPSAGHAPQFQYPELSTTYINAFLNDK